MMVFPALLYEYYDSEFDGRYNRQYYFIVVVVRHDLMMCETMHHTEGLGRGGCDCRVLRFFRFPCCAPS